MISRKVLFEDRILQRGKTQHIAALCKYLEKQKALLCVSFALWLHKVDETRTRSSCCGDIQSCSCKRTGSNVQVLLRAGWKYNKGASGNARLPLSGFRKVQEKCHQ